MFDTHDRILIIAVIEYLAYIREKKKVAVAEEHPAREVISSGYFRYKKSGMRKFCGERSVVYIVPVLSVLVYLPSTVEQLGMSKGPVIDRCNLHRGGGPTSDGVRTDLERNVFP